MKRRHTIALVFILLSVSTDLFSQSGADTQYICWKNHPTAIVKNQVLIKLYPEYESETAREAVFEAIRAEISDEIEIHPIAFGWFAVHFPYHLEDIRIEIRTLNGMEGIRYAEPNVVTFVQKGNVAANVPFSSDKGGLSVDSDLLDFADVYRNEVGCRIIAVTNHSDEHVQAQVRIGGDDATRFRILEGITSIEVPPDASSILELEFRPDGIRSYGSMLHIETMGSEPQSVRIPLTGTGRLGSTSAGNTDDLPRHITLEQNVPNPFNPSTQIRYAIRQSSHVRLTVHTLLGGNVAILVDGTRSSGWQTVHFDASNLSSGIYLYRLETQDGVVQRLMTVIK